MSTPHTTNSNSSLICVATCTILLAVSTSLFISVVAICWLALGIAFYRLGRGVGDS
jgi:hypothetical protein